VRYRFDHGVDANSVHPLGHHQLAGVAVHAGLTLGVTYLNFKLLPGPIKPKMWIVVANVAWSIILFVYFAVWTIYDNPLGLKL